VTKNVSQHAEISCTHVEQVVQLSCDASTEHHVDTIDDASNGLSMIAQSDGTAVQVKGQCSSIFQSQCKIHDKVCKLIIDGGGFINVLVQIWVLHYLYLYKGFQRRVICNE
jgi:hypothetical protein